MQGQGNFYCGPCVGRNRFLDKTFSATENFLKNIFPTDSYLPVTMVYVLAYPRKSHPSAAENFEQSLMPTFVEILEKDVGELVPYVFQIMGLLLQVQKVGFSIRIKLLLKYIGLPACICTDVSTIIVAYVMGGVG